MTSNWRGSRTSSMAKVSMYRWRESTSGYSARTDLKVRCQRPWAKVMALDLSAMQRRRGLWWGPGLAVGVAGWSCDEDGGVNPLLGGGCGTGLADSLGRSEVRPLRVPMLEPPGVVEGVAENAFHAFAGVDFFLRCDFVGGSLFEEAAGAGVDAFGIFAKDHHANVVADAIFEQTMKRSLRSSAGRALT